jgi:carbon storage regulator
MSGGLTLTRKINESVVIGDNIEVTVVEVRSDGRVRLRFNAPDNVTIYRRELYDIVEEERGTMTNDTI